MKKNKKNLRFLATLWIIKLMIRVFRLLGKNGTHVPGTYALKLCPDFLDRIDKPQHIIGVTGTNGKTTVSNLITDVLQDQGYDVVENRFGGNINTGIAAALIKNATLTGAMRKQYAVLEVDERMTTKIFPYIKPELLVVTNLFRDSYRRNAHSDFIAGILNSTIPAESKLILNSEDLVSNQLAPGNARAHFGIGVKDYYRATKPSLINDMRSCPKCGSKLDFDYIRYNHIGKASCPHCGFHSPETEYSVEKVDTENRLITLHTAKGDTELKLMGDNITDVYNTATVFAVLSEFGLAPEKIKASLDKMQITQSRYRENVVNGKHVICVVAKGQNPIAVSRICDFVSKEPGKKTVVLCIDDFYDRQENSENIAWFFDTDMEFLNDPDIVRIVCSGLRNDDMHIRLLMAGVPEEKIDCVDDENMAGDFVNFDECDRVYILHDIYTTHLALNVSDKLCERLKKGGK